MKLVNISDFCREPIVAQRENRFKIGKDYYAGTGRNQACECGGPEEGLPQADHEVPTGAEEPFKQVGEAYEVDSDEKKRRIYDQVGEEGLKGGAGPAGKGEGGGMPNFQGGGNFTFQVDPRETFDKFFGSGGFGGNIGGLGGFGGSGGGVENMDVDYISRPGKRARLQDPTVHKEVYVTLEDLMTGVDKKMKLTRKVYNDNGAYSTEEKILKITVKPGWKAGTKITFAEEGDRVPGKQPADVVFSLREKPHELFRRDGDDLLYTHTVSLGDALCGTAVPVSNLQGGKFHVDCSTDVLKPKEVKRWRGRGLPSHKNPGVKGDIVVDFDIKFPDRLTEENNSLLRKALR